MKDDIKRALLACIMCLIFASSNGCIVIHDGGSPLQGEFEKKIDLSAPMSPGECLWSETDNGSITIKGTELMECRVTATIIAHAIDDADARRLADETIVELIPVNGRLEIKIEKPQSKGRSSVNVNLDVSVPSLADLDLSARNGHMNIAEITGNVRGKSYNGKISTENTSGDVRLETYNGNVSCMDISGKAQITSYNGNLRASYSGEGASLCDISMKTYNGSVRFISSPGLSVMIDASTQNGSIKTDLPITATGKLEKKRLNGILGSGQGRLYLATYNGSIEIK